MNGETVGRPDDDLVCYVRVQGPFSRLGTHLGPYSPGKKVILTAKFADMVFDGQTGNMLVWGMENS
ncbi:hypothetical protein KDK_13430 [Dictyobacter kobayashii]|uniref:Uncharacterized protein n=1 Tax=Dictyobacter kobayashii TaxID=2014872 RepID=A0A402AEN2_9CHLR|nr:hypothetical protein KDK_13430 [Dictyobacter kobayashii]